MVRLQEYRVREGFSRAELATKVGIDEETVARYERGEREPRASTLLAFSRILNCTIDELVNQDPEK